MRWTTILTATALVVYGGWAGAEGTVKGRKGKTVRYFLVASKSRKKELDGNGNMKSPRRMNTSRPLTGAEEIRCG